MKTLHKLIWRIRRRFGWYSLRSEGADWVRDNLGAEYVSDFIEKYDSLCRGIPIGGFVETAVFLDMIEQIKKDKGIYEDAE